MRLSEKEYRALLQKSPKIAGLAGSTPLPCPKYHNVKVYVYPDGMVSYGEKLDRHGKPEVYDSIKEYERGLELALLQRAGQISELRRQVPYLVQAEAVVEGKKLRPIIYRADYAYCEKSQRVVEDVKPLDRRTGSHKVTKDFALKWKILKAKYPDTEFRLY